MSIKNIVQKIFRIRPAIPSLNRPAGSYKQVCANRVLDFRLSLYICINMKYIGVFICLFLSGYNLLAQSGNYIVIKSAKGQTIPFTLSAKPKVEVVNNLMNIALTDTKGDMIQINGIRVKFLKTPSKALQKVKLVYINPASNKSSVTTIKHWRRDITIKCDNCTTGDTMIISGKEQIFVNGQLCTVSFRFEYRIPKSIYIKADAN